MVTVSKKLNFPSLSDFGKQGEALTQDWLKKNNYQIIATNYRTKQGEIDIIARQKNIIAFIEVKLRSTNYFNLSQVITISKQKKIIATAQHYCFRHLKEENGMLILRFDVALIHKEHENFSLEYIPNAFTQPSLY